MSMNYCSHCGSDRLVWHVPPGDDRPRYVCEHCGTVHYQNPKMVAGCLPVYEEKVLLCRRAIEPRYGLWTLPAGFLENGETAEEGALRETWEEARAHVQILRLHALYSLPHINQIYVFFLAQLPEPSFGAGPESLDVALFAQEEIPWEEMAFSSARFALQRYFADRSIEKEKAFLGSYRPDL